MRRASVLDDAQPPGGNLLRDPVVEDDHAIGDIFLQPVLRQRADAPLGGDDRRDLLLLEPPEQTAKFGAQDGGVLETGEDRLHGVRYDPLGVERVNGGPEADEQPFQVVLAGLLDLVALDAYVTDLEFLLLGKGVQVEPEGTDVLNQFLGGFLEGQEDARLGILSRPPDKELHRQEGFAAAGTAADERGPASGQSAAGHFVQTLDARRTFFQPRLGGVRVRCRLVHWVSSDF